MHRKAKKWLMVFWLSWTFGSERVKALLLYKSHLRHPLWTGLFRRETPPLRRLLGARSLDRDLQGILWRISLQIQDMFDNKADHTKFEILNC